MSYNSETSLIMFKNILAILFTLKLVKHSKFYASKFKFEDYSGLIYTHLEHNLNLKVKNSFLVKDLICCNTIYF